MGSEVLIVIPVFNEYERWDDHYFKSLPTDAPKGSRFIFVDDGSDDGSLDLIINFCESSESYSYISCEINGGKSEAVRIGMLQGVDAGYSGIGFLDADGAFEASDIARILYLFEEKCLGTNAWKAVWSSRIDLAGRNIVRNGKRHFIGRLISKIICMFIEDSPWDTQSGFKIFRVDNELKMVLNRPFRTKWFFEIEILQRYVAKFGSPLTIWEEPVNSWKDVKGSKIVLKRMPSIFLEILKIVYENYRTFGIRSRRNYY
jgi:dolichyl-phosphate beta-glucosyltransferase